MFGRGQNPIVRAESARRLWLFVAAYPLFVMGITVMLLGTLNDSDDFGRYEWVEPWYVRLPLAIVCLVASTAATWLRVRELYRRRRGGGA